MDNLEKGMSDLSVDSSDFLKQWKDFKSSEKTEEHRLQIITSFSKRIKQLGPTELLSPTEKKHGIKLLKAVTDFKVEELRKSVHTFMCKLISVYRHMLLKEKCELMDIGENLLRMTECWRRTKLSSSPEVVAMRNNVYAYSWNFVRENHKNLEPEKCLRFLSQALRWLLRQGLSSLSSVSYKLQQLSHVVDKCPEFDSVQLLLEDIVAEAQEVWITELDEEKSTDPAIVDGVYNFCICVLRFLASFRRLEEEEKLLLTVIKALCSLLSPEAGASVEALIMIFQRHMKYISHFENDVNQETLETVIINRLPANYSIEGISEILKNVVENTLCEGANLIVYHGYVQGISGYLQQILKSPMKNIEFEDAEELCLFIRPICIVTECLRDSQLVESVAYLGERRRESESQVYLLILRLIMDYVGQKKAISSEVLNVVEHCFEKLNALINNDLQDQDNINDIGTKLGFYGGQISTTLVRMSDYPSALRILKLAIEVAERFSNTNKQNCVDPSQLGMVMADVYNRTNQHEYSLRLLAEMLPKYSHVQEQCDRSTCVDLLVGGSWYDWGYQWISAKRSAYAGEAKDLLFKTALSYVLDSDKFKSSLDSGTIVKILYCELKAYFSTKSTIPDGLIGVGEELVRYSTTSVDKSIGLLAQAIGFWWGGFEQVTDAISCCEDGLAELNSETNVESQIVIGLIHGWHGLSNCRKLQETAVMELEGIKADDIIRNPKKYGGSDDGLNVGRVIPAVSSLTIEQESLVAKHLVKSIDLLYDVFTTSKNDIVSEAMKKLGSGLVLSTLRVVGDMLNALGYQSEFLKSCIVLKALAVAHERIALNLLVTSELLRCCPSLQESLNAEVDELKTKVISIQSPSAAKKYDQYFMKLSLANAVACLRSTRYQEAVGHIAAVFEYRTSPDLLDVGLQVVGEAYYVMAELKLVESDLNLDFASIPKYVKYLSPAGLVNKGFKTLAMVSRSPAPIDSGWNDLFHNYNLLATVMNTSESAIKYHYMCGKLREARCMGADFIFLAQQSAMISRTIDILLPLAEMDIASRNFDSCQQKVDCIMSMIKGHIPDSSEPIRNNSCDQLIKKLHISSPELESVMFGDDETFDYCPVSLPSHNFGMYGPPPADLSASPTITVNMKMKRVIYLHHKLHCNCHICLHPKIIPNVIRFYCLQARLASCNARVLDSVRILEAANKFHLKAILRLLYHCQDLQGVFERVFTPAQASDILTSIFSNFCVQPGLISQLTKMEMMPDHMLKHSIPSFHNLSEGLRLLGLDHKVYLSIGLEVLAAAVFRAIFQDSSDLIKRSSIGELSDKIEDGDGNFENETSPERSNEPSAVPVVLLPRRRMAYRKPQSDSEDENLPDAEYINGVAKSKRVPVLNFEVDDEKSEESDTETGGRSETECPSRNTRSRAQ